MYIRVYIIILSTIPCSFHVVRTLQPDNIKTLCDSITTAAREYCPSIFPEAQAVSTTFSEAFTLFNECHNIYDKNHVNDTDTVQLCK